MAITALPTPPTRNDPANFSERADAFLTALPAFATEANTLQTDVNAKQTAAAANQVAAAAAQSAAEAASAATIWVSGTTYAVGNVRFSPIDFKSYRRKTAGAGTTDPSADSTNWQLLTGLGNVDLTATQTLTNKTINGASNTITNVSLTAGITGTLPIANGGTAATTAATAFNNIKQAATEDATGVVELATTAEAAAGTDTTRVVTPAGVASAVPAITATLTLGAVGTYAYLARSPIATVTEGNTESGSNLRYAGHYIDASANTAGLTGTTPTGTWRAMGRTQGSGVWTATVWLRIA